MAVPSLTAPFHGMIGGMRPEDIDISALGAGTVADTTLRLTLGKGDFAYVCMCLDELLGRRVLAASSYGFDSLSRDRVRQCYPELVAQLCRDTALGDELPLLFRYMMLAVKGRNESPEGRPLGMSKSCKKAQLPFRDEEQLRAYVMGYARHCPFEPAWHRNRRGDSRRIRNTFPDNAWSWLVRMYTDPDSYDREEPEHVRNARRRVKGYAHCLDMAKSEALRELRSRYGADYGRSGAGHDRLLRDGDHRAVMSMDDILSGASPF